MNISKTNFATRNHHKQTHTRNTSCARQTNRAGTKKRLSGVVLTLGFLSGCHARPFEKDTIAQAGKMTVALPSAPSLILGGGLNASVGQEERALSSIKWGFGASFGLPAASSMLTFNTFSVSYSRRMQKGCDVPLVRQAAITHKNEAQALPKLSKAIENAEDIFAIDTFGNSVLSAAADNFHPFILKYIVDQLKKNPNPSSIRLIANFKNAYGKIPLDYLYGERTDQHSLETLKTIISWTNKEGRDRYFDHLTKRMSSSDDATIGHENHPKMHKMLEQKYMDLQEYMKTL